MTAAQRFVTCAAIAGLASGAAVLAGQSSPIHSSHEEQAPQGMPAQMTGHDHDHGTPVPAVTLGELEETTRNLVAARDATAKYQDVRTAEAAGYRPVGPNVRGMGIHYVRSDDRQRFSITEPPILLYERDATSAGGLRLVGVSYLLVAPADSDGQPKNPPFPKALASWHKHNNVCVLPDNNASVDLSAAQCEERGGRFTAETSWMIHAWIWKDSPAGVFSPTNPLVK